MCEMGTCRTCRMELRQIDGLMGSTRSYLDKRQPRTSRSARGIGNGLDDKRKSSILPYKAPLSYPEGCTRAERAALLAEERKNDREPVLIDGEIRMVSIYCPCHGTYSGYINWHCRCGNCTPAYKQHRASKRIVSTRNKNTGYNDPYERNFK